MADNIAITAGSGTAVRTDDIGGVHYQVVKLAHGADGSLDGLVDDASPMPVTLGTSDPLLVGMTRGILAPTTTITRPANTTAYAAGDALSDSTSAPTSGGFTLTSVVGASGKSAILTDMMVVSSNAPATPLQGEIWLFNTSVTAINDNAAFAITDAEALTVVGIIPFALSSIGNNSIAHVLCNMGILTSGSANLRFLVRVVNAYTPASAETLTVMAKFQGLN